MAGPGTGAAVVTGAARGLGLQIARRLVASGRPVFVADLDEAAVTATADELAAARPGSTVVPVALDVRDPDACAALAARAADEHGALAVWVNNAGILGTGPSFQQPVAVQRTIVEVNTIGTINGTLAALVPMRAQGRGAIINVVSLAGLSPVPGMAAYSASKHAALAFSLSTLGELRATGTRGVSISCLCPAGIWTPMLQDKTHDFWASASFGGTLLDAGEVADRAVALVERPRPVTAVPRFMGPVSHLVSAAPRLTTVLTPLVLRAAAVQQRRNAARLERRDT